ncbi:hypothetical protein GCM10028774_27200 [Spirosoma jeollabukense]
MMTTIQPIRTLFINGIIVLFILLVLVEAVTWTIASEAKLSFIKENGDILTYLGLLVRNTILPEMVTVFFLTLSVNGTQHWVNSKFVNTTTKSLVSYQLIFLPVLLVIYLIFIPFTQSVRYLLVELSNYSFTNYWHRYITDSYSFASYFKYLFPVLFIGYGALNISLLTRSLRNDSVMGY